MIPLPSAGQKIREWLTVSTVKLLLDVFQEPIKAGGGCQIVVKFYEGKFTISLNQSAIPSVGAIATYFRPFSPDSRAVITGKEGEEGLYIRYNVARASKWLTPIFFDGVSVLGNVYVPIPEDSTGGFLKLVPTVVPGATTALAWFPRADLVFSSDPPSGNEIGLFRVTEDLQLIQLLCYNQQPKACPPIPDRSTHFAWAGA